MEVCLSKRNPHFKRSLLCADFYVKPVAGSDAGPDTNFDTRSVAGSDAGSGVSFDAGPCMNFDV